jgi:hypothetical protein
MRITLLFIALGSFFITSCNSPEPTPQNAKSIINSQSERGMPSTDNKNNAVTLNQFDKMVVLSGDIEGKDMSRFAKEIADTSRPEMSAACRAMRQRMSELRNEHADMHETLLELQRQQRICMANQSDKNIGNGACSQWEENAEGVRESQKRMYEAFEQMQEEMQRACQ